MVKLGVDINSYANFQQVTTQHLDLVWNVDFDRKVLHGHVDITAKILDQQAQHMLLDTKGVSIQAAEHLDLTDAATAPCLWTMPQHHPALGVCLSLPLPAADKRKAKDTAKFRVHFSTTSSSGGIQWLEAHQTAGGKHPFAYTQFEAILARTCLPCQDSPSVKAPFTATVVVPHPLVAVCSGLPTTQSVEDREGKKVNVYKFEQKVPVPSYLIAMASGAIVSGKIGPRSTVYCEQELLEASIHEFSAQTESFIQAGEKITGIPYEWGKYDLLVLPSAFPYGGMENPNLTFISASLLAGDRSLVDVVAHEIAHSWAGNLVTNNSWGDFWLNEGFTMYLERAILGHMHNEKARLFDSLCGYEVLVKAVQELNESHDFTKLYPNMEDIDPDDAFSRIPYEKGFFFLFYLEQVVGGLDKMKEWLHSYFTTFSMKSVSHHQMKDHFINFFTAKGVDISKIDWNTWIYGTGMPPFDFKPLLSKYGDTCSQLAHSWMNSSAADVAKITADSIKGFSPQEVMYFLDVILTSGKVLPDSHLEAMNTIYQLEKSNNVEIAFRWLMLCLQCNYRAALPQVERFLSRHGRGIYLRPMYRELARVDHAFASSVYRKNRSFYHSVIRNSFDSML